MQTKGLDALYASKGLQKDVDKRVWLESYITKKVLKEKTVLPNETLLTVAKNHDEVHLLTLLSDLEPEANANAFFCSLLAEEKIRSALFEKGVDAFQTYLGRYDAVTILSDYLRNYSSEPWFAKELSLFVPSIEEKNPDLLVQTLERLAGRVAKGEINVDACHQVMDAFISQEETAKIVLRAFLGDKDFLRPVQTTNTERLKAFTRFFTKDMLMGWLMT